MFDKAEYYFNREISWLKFNTRVLQESDDIHVPLLERLKFIGISSSNLDEFFMVRVAGIKHLVDNGILTTDESGLTPAQQYGEISEAAHEQVKQEYKYLKNILLELEKWEMFFHEMEELSEKNKEWVRQYFQTTIYPVLTPLAVDSSHPFPFVANRSLNLAVMITNDKDKLDVQTAVVQVPSVLPRIVEIPGSGKKRHFVFLEDIITQHCGELFHGQVIKDIAPFRITRDADLSIDEEAVDLLQEVKKSLRQRKRGEPVRLEIGKSMSRALRRFLQEQLGIDEAELYEINGPLDATCFMKFADMPGYESLKRPPLKPELPPALQQGEDLFQVIREKDLLLHHPYESFDPVVEFVEKAAVDPAVLAIKQTLYRVGGNSPIVRALAQAAENGKQVTVLVELKARFDEENNIEWAQRLEDAGCHVIYGLVGLKTHAKMALVVRRESGGIKRYVHMSTGNYNDITAKIYTDLGMFTANDQFGADASAFFNLISGYSDPPVWNKIVVAPLGLREKIYELLDREMEHARAGRPARMIAKMNSLVDYDVVRKLYEASSAGVIIDLIIRGICVLRPGVPGVSENISVRSIVGRFLEHSRVFFFANGGDDRVFMSSADWMPRNLNGRVELLFPVDDEDHVERIKDMLELQLVDRRKAHTLRNDGVYRKVEKSGKGLNSQEELYKLAVQAAKEAEELPLEQKLKPIYRREE